MDFEYGLPPCSLFEFGMLCAEVILEKVLCFLIVSSVRFGLIRTTEMISIKKIFIFFINIHAPVDRVEHGLLSDLEMISVLNIYIQRKK